MLTREQLTTWLEAHGYTRSPRRPNAYIKTAADVNGKPETYRYYFGKRTLRREVRLASRWLRLRSGYYAALGFDEAGKLTGMTH